MKFRKFVIIDWPITIIVFVTIAISLLMLWSIAPFVFPQYFLYVLVALFAFFLFSKTDFQFLTSVSGLMYICSIIFLLTPIVFGIASRGAVRWIFFGNSSIQPAELVRPFLILFFAKYFTEKALDIKRILKGIILMAIPLVLIFMQPSLGVTILTAAGFFGVLITSRIPPKLIFGAILATLLAVPIMWPILEPYQKTRILAIVNPSQDPTGASYNSIQSMIAVGAGSLTGRGLGKGIQTQLSFLPEKHNDFIFASTAEELGFLGALLLLSLTFLLLYRLIKISEVSRSSTGRAYIIGIFMSLFLQVIVHVGMNMGMLPVTGLPFPLVSYGGSSLLGTLIMYGIALQAKSASGTIHQYEIRSVEGSWKSI